MACILVLATAFVAPPVTVHRHRVNDLHINALTDVNLLIEAAVGIFGAGFAGWKMSQDGKDAEPSAAITAKMPPLDGKVVSSWYDSGMRLTSEAKVMVSATEAPVKPVVSWYDSGKRLGGEAVSSEPKAIKSPVAMRNEKSILSKPMPPPGFVWAEDLADAAPATPPAKPVVSWYDSGKRLSAPVTVATKTASTQVEWPALGGSGAFHPMRGPWPKAPAREQWTPPPGWTKPSKPVLSWYDKGERLSSQQAPIIQATKANIMPKGGWVVTQPDGATEQVGWSTGMPSETSLATPGSPNRAPQIVLLGAVLGGAFLAARSFGIRML